MIDVDSQYAEEFHVTQELIRGFAAVSGDMNPIHLDEEHAKNSMFGRPIAHGMLIASFISSILGNKLPGHGTIYLKQELNFLAPVYAGDRVNVVVKIVEKKESKPVYKLDTTCFVGTIKVLDGYAWVKFQQ